MRNEKTLPLAQPPVTDAIIASHGLTAEEYQKIVQMLGREPNYTELGVFSVMWSGTAATKARGTI